LGKALPKIEATGWLNTENPPSLAGLKPMFHPVHIDGRKLVIIRRGQSILDSPFTEVMSGRLEYDGSELTLVSDCRRRIIAGAELASLVPVKEDTRISQCHGFDIFTIDEPER
jgi:hypothetical protein